MPLVEPAPGLSGSPYWARIAHYSPRQVAHQVQAAALIIDAGEEELFDIADNGRAVHALLRNRVPTKYVEIEGKRYSHILDPKTGLGLTTRSSVTIIAPKGIDADSLASAVSVLGVGAGLKLVEQTADTEALVLTQGEAGAEAHLTSGIDQLLDSE